MLLIAISVAVWGDRAPSAAVPKIQTNWKTIVGWKAMNAILGATGREMNSYFKTSELLRRAYKMVPPATAENLLPMTGTVRNLAHAVFVQEKYSEYSLLEIHETIKCNGNYRRLLTGVFELNRSTYLLTYQSDTDGAPFRSLGMGDSGCMNVRTSDSAGGLTLNKPPGACGAPPESKHT
ncbi:hypothetical protein BaRGS_00031023 [Batillaria attramentaria]|uniref:Uncharacterized protein n=1 Tax=Batillaria attramentaria TaxID=370345 RepID=A0ABD0JSS8_9CAEN